MPAYTCDLLPEGKKVIEHSNGLLYLKKIDLCWYIFKLSNYMFLNYPYHNLNNLATCINKKYINIFIKHFYAYSIE